MVDYFLTKDDVILLSVYVKISNIVKSNTFYCTSRVYLKSDLASMQIYWPFYSITFPVKCNISKCWWNIVTCQYMLILCMWWVLLIYFADVPKLFHFSMKVIWQFISTLLMLLAAPKPSHILLQVCVFAVFIFSIHVFSDYSVHKILLWRWGERCYCRNSATK